ncbi:unnamed protein product [Bemisia tabaci]|uniref:Cuticular protein n=1 Tax=Bemisia tabaci TaxID=7038 RepID=A0A9P0A943_BEMTA|nr:unnamed protein product [Bemisia tabaci]
MARSFLARRFVCPHVCRPPTMFTLRIHLVLPVCLIAIGIAGLTNGQQFGENSVGEQEQDFDYEEPAPVPSRFQGKGQLTRTRTSAQPTTPRAPPVQILKQINRHNEDGSYTYGFEGSDGSFKIETKLANGEVKGKYGYVDDSGKVRVVEYGANRYGFQPSGEGITVAPPTLVDESKSKKKKVPSGSRLQGPSPLQIALGSRDQGIPVSEESSEYDDGQDFEDQQQAQPQPIAQPQPQPQPQFPSRNAGRVAISSRARPVARPAVAAPVAPVQRPSANFEFGINSDQASFQQQQSFGAAPQQQSFAQQSFAQQSFNDAPSSGPVPPRAQVPGAAPVAPAAPAAPIFVPTGRSRGQPRPAPQFLDFQAPQARQVSRSAPRPNSGAASSFDDLEKQYALPSGGSNPTHDFQFGAAF